MFQVQNIHTPDIEAHQQALAPWHLELIQLSSGAFSGHLTALNLNDIILYEETWNKKLILQGASPENYFMLGIPKPNSQNSGYQWRSQTVNQQTSAFSTSSKETHIISDLNSQHYVLLVPYALIESQLPQIFEWIHITQTEAIQSSEQQKGLLCDLLAHLLIKYQTPQSQHDEVFDAKLLLAQFADFIESSQGNHAQENHKHQLFLSAFEIALKTHTSCTELTALLNVSSRQLNSVFNESVALSPHRFLKTLKLNKAHKELIRASETTVTDIASNQAFTELGRFAVEYKNWFGVSPSVSLKQPQRSTSPLLALK